MAHEPTPLQRIFSKRSLLGLLVANVVTAFPVVASWLWVARPNILPSKPSDGPFSNIHAESTHICEMALILLPSQLFCYSLIVIVSKFLILNIGKQFPHFYGLNFILSLLMTFFLMLVLGDLGIPVAFVFIMNLLPLTLLSTIYWHFSSERKLDGKAIIAVFPIFLLWFGQVGFDCLVPPF